MKILPDYLIEYMPALEEALEELRMSLIDHAYDLLKCLDIDELSSDDVRRKLEVYNIKLENMSSDWLPNGRFYRMYPSIKHHRTRKNAIDSIVKSGGQFEGVWSDSFSEKTQYNYANIQLLRHYELGSNLDGYFYISGDVGRNKSGSISSSTIEALSSDILLAQTLPAGYTYIYVPWPRPLYPSDSNYFYNVHMLQFDRFHYTEDCNKPYYSGSTSYSTDYPASMKYYDIRTKKQPPYWYDYHCIGTNEHPNYSESRKWPIKESGYYINDKGTKIAKLNIKAGGLSSMYTASYDGDIQNWDKEVIDIQTINDINSKAVDYVLDNTCSFISDSHTNWITNCYLRTRYSTTSPSRSQKFTPVEYAIVFNDVISKDALKDALLNVLKKDNDTAESIINSDVISVQLKVDDYTDDYIKEIKDGLYTSSGVSILSHDEDNIDELSCSIAGRLNDRSAATIEAIRNAISSNNLQAILDLVDESIHKSDIIDFIKSVPKSPIILEDFDASNRSAIASLLASCYDVNEQDAENLLMLNKPITLYEFSTDKKFDAFAVINSLQQLGCRCSYSGNIITHLTYSNFSYSVVENSIDENCLIEPALEFSPKAGAYKFDRLTAGLMYKVSNSLHHIKTYKPVWDVPSPIFAMSQSDWQPAEYEVTITNATSEQASSIATNIYSLIGKTQSDIPSIAGQIYAKQPLPIVDSNVIEKLILGITSVNSTIQYKCVITNLIVDANYSIVSVTDNGDSFKNILQTVYWYSLEDATSAVNNLITNHIPIKVESSNSYSIQQSIDMLLDNHCIIKPTLKSASNHSLYYWTELKQHNNIPSLSESTISQNIPPVSNETFTSFDRPTIGRLDPIYTAFFYAKQTGSSPKQDTNYTLNSIVENNEIYYYDDLTGIQYDPTLYYTIINFCKDDHGNETVLDSSNSYIQGDPATKKLFINKNNQSDAIYNCITYKTSKVHMLWFHSDKSDGTVPAHASGPLYNSVGKSDDLYHFTANNNTVYVRYNVLGIYKNNGTKVEGGNPTITCVLHGSSTDSSKYVVTYGLDTTLFASYILFTVDVGPGEVKETQYVQIEKTMHYHPVASTMEIVNIGDVMWHYAPPSISGGEYSSTNFNTEHYINGNLYNSSEFDVE